MPTGTNRNTKRMINRLEHSILQQKKELDRIADILTGFKASLNESESEAQVAASDEETDSHDRDVSPSSDGFDRLLFLTANPPIRKDVPCIGVHSAKNNAKQEIAKRLDQVAAKHGGSPADYIPDSYNTEILKKTSFHDLMEAKGNWFTEVEVTELVGLLIEVIADGRDSHPWDYCPQFAVPGSTV